MLKSQNSMEINKTIENIRNAKDSKGKELLVEFLKDFSYSEDRAAILWGLEVFETSELLEIYVSFLNDPNFLVRQYALNLIENNIKSNEDLERVELTLRQYQDFTEEMKCLSEALHKSFEINSNVESTG